MDPDCALVLFSGGQDSTVCLAWALERFARVETVGFDYEQRHRAEQAGGCTMCGERVIDDLRPDGDSKADGDEKIEGS